MWGIIWRLVWGIAWRLGLAAAFLWLAGIMFPVADLTAHLLVAYALYAICKQGLKAAVAAAAEADNRPVDLDAINPRIERNQAVKDSGWIGETPP